MCFIVNDLVYNNVKYRVPPPKEDCTGTNSRDNSYTSYTGGSSYSYVKTSDVVIVLIQITCKRSSTLLFLTRTHTHNRHTVYMYRCISRLPRFLLDRIVLQIMMSHRQPSVDDLSLELMTLVPGGPFSTNCTDVVIPPEVLYIGVKFRRWSSLTKVFLKTVTISPPSHSQGLNENLFIVWLTT